MRSALATVLQKPRSQRGLGLNLRPSYYAGRVVTSTDLDADGLCYVYATLGGEAFPPNAREAYVKMLSEADLTATGFLQAIIHLDETDYADPQKSAEMSRAPWDLPHDVDRSTLLMFVATVNRQSESSSAVARASEALFDQFCRTAGIGSSRGYAQAFDYDPRSCWYYRP